MATWKHLGKVEYKVGSREKGCSVSTDQPLGLPFSSPGDLPDPGIKLISPEAPALADRFFTIKPRVKPQGHV